MTRLVDAGRRGDLDLLVLDSPANRNAMSVRLLDELAQGVAASAAGNGRGLVLDHTGPVFCAGVDLRERRALGPGDDAHSRGLARVLAGLWNYPKPVVARVGGPVRGGGMGLLACADLVLASGDATFAYSEVSVGVAPALVMAVTLPSVSLRSLLPWLLTGQVFDAQTALALGLVTQVHDGAGGGTVDATVAALVRGAPVAQQAIKRLARVQQGVDMGATLSAMTRESAELFRSPEAHEGMAAFTERRPPAWA